MFSHLPILYGCLLAKKVTFHIISKFNLSRFTGQNFWAFATFPLPHTMFWTNEHFFCLWQMPFFFITLLFLKIGKNWYICIWGLISPLWFSALQLRDLPIFLFVLHTSCPVWLAVHLEPPSHTCANNISGQKTSSNVFTGSHYNVYTHIVQPHWAEVVW